MKKIIVLSFIATLIIILSTQSCKKSSYAPSCSSTTPSYTTDVKPLIQSYCVSCHSNYSSYSGASSNKNSIRASVVDGSMPKNSSLTNDQKNKINCWIDAGAPNN